MDMMSDGSESDRRSRASSSTRGERRRILHGGAESYRSSLMNDEESWGIEPDLRQERSSSQLKSARPFEDPIRYNENPERFGIPVHQRMDDEVMRYSNTSPSNFPLRSRNRSDVDEFGEPVEDPAELLRQMEELKEKLSRSRHSVEMGKDRVPINIRHPDPHISEQYDIVHGPETDHGSRHVRGGTRGRTPLGNFSPQYSNPEAQFRRPTYQNRHAEPPHMMRREEMDANGFYPPQYNSSQSRYPVRNPVLYQEKRSYPYMDDGMEYVETIDQYPSNVIRHHPFCSCYQCFDRRQVNDKYSDTTYHENQNSFGSRDHSQQMSHSSSGSRNPMRYPSDVNSEVDGFVRRRPPRVQLVSTGKSCRSIAGGSPILACPNCSQLLLLRKKVASIKKMRCGGCSTLMVFTLSFKKLVVEIEVEETDTLEKNDYDDSNYDYHSMDKEFGQLSVKSENLTVAVEDPNSADLAREDKEAKPLAHSSLQHLFEYSNKYHRGGRFGQGDGSEHGKELPNKPTPRQISREESSATEIDLSSNEYPNTGTTFGSADASRDGARSRTNRVAESFFEGINEDSYPSDFTVDEGKAVVTVNGHLIPDRLIKKAEKMAGTIQPGNFWYDFRAGFWGALGGPCLGIIPPFIEQFNYPMPEHCAGGNTGVFVNGRELSQKDLKLLSNRGLPTDNDRAYIVEISGRVLDEETGEELQSLGKLAPSVERNKCGFGMRDPNPVAPTPR